MRVTTVTVLLAALVGCAEDPGTRPTWAGPNPPGPVDAVAEVPEAPTAEASARTMELVYRTEYQTSHTGATISDDGNSGWIGMNGVSCKFGIAEGWITEDLDLLEDGGDEILDEGDDDDGVGAVLVALNDEVTRYREDHKRWTIEVPGFVDARIVNLGFAAVADDPEHGCTAQWWTGGEIAFASELPDGLCAMDPDIAVDRDAERMFVAAGQIWQIDADGASQVPLTEGSFVAWDSKPHVLYVGNADRIQAMDPDHLTTRWQRRVSGPITDVETLGNRGAVLVSTRGDDSRLYALGGLTGEAWMNRLGPNADLRLDVAANGSRVAFVLGSQISYHDVKVE